MIIIYISFSLILILLLLFLVLNKAIKHGLEYIVPEITKTPFTLGKSNVFIIPAKGTLSKIILGNPQGFETASSFEMNTIRVSINLSSLFSRKLIIESVEIKSPSITYEINGTENNIKTILDNVKAASEENSSKDKPQKKTKKIQINNFTITDGSINLSITQLEGNTLPIPMPNIKLTDLGKETDGKGAPEIFEEIFSVINNDVVSLISNSSDPALKAASFTKALFKKL